MSALTKYGVELEVCLGIGRQDERGVWDDGRWDRERWGRSDTSLGDWVDVTCDVSDPLRLAAGASDSDGVVTRWEAATCSFTLYGARYDPWHGPWEGLLGPLTPVRLRWRPEGTGEWSTAFTGAVSPDGWQYDPLGSPPATALAATDATQALVAFDGVAQDLQGVRETAAARVTRILDMAYWPPELRDVTAGGVPLQGTTLAQAAWTMLLQVADTDLALLWVTRQGKLAYRPQGRVGTGTELAGQLVVCPTEDYRDIQVITLAHGQPGDVRNVVSVSRKSRTDDDDAKTVTRIDRGSAARYLARSYTRTDLLHDDDDWSGTVADAILAASAWPSAAPREVRLSSQLRDPRVPQLLLALEPSYTFDVLDSTRRAWREGCIGWDVQVGIAAIEGVIKLDDLTRWVAGRWDDQGEAAGWDRQRWGINYTAAAARLTDRKAA